MRRTAIAITAAALVSGTTILATASAQSSGVEAIHVNTVASAARAAAPPPVVPTAIFTGVVKQVIDPVTLVIARDAPAGSGDRNDSGTAGLVTVRLWGVVPPTAGTMAATGARGILGKTVGARVRVEQRDGANAASKRAAPVSALVYVLPSNTGTYDSPPPLPEQKAPAVALVPTRAPDATNMTPNLRGDLSHPNQPVSATIPQPAPAPAVRADDGVNFAVVRQGFAQWDRRAAPNSTELQNAQHDAQKARRGIWMNIGR